MLQEGNNTKNEKRETNVDDPMAIEFLSSELDDKFKKTELDDKVRTMTQTPSLG